MGSSSSKQITIIHSFKLLQSCKLLNEIAGCKSILLDNDITGQWIDGAQRSVIGLGTGSCMHYIFTQQFPIVNFDKNSIYHQIAEAMIKESKIKDVKNFSIEHRRYQLNDIDCENPFIGETHDDCCEHTLIWYYNIDPSIKGGEIKFKDQIFKPEQGDLLIFHGQEHQVQSLYGRGNRDIITVFVNGHP